LIFVLSISETFTQKIKDELENQGMIINLANAEYTATGLEPVRPPQFDEKLTSIIKSEITGVQNVALISNPFWNEFIYDQKQYRIRNVVGSTEEYSSLTGMKLVSGTFFTADDVTKGNKIALISKSLAEMLFGSAEKAIGKQVKPPAPQIVVRNQNQTATANNSTTQGSGTQNQNRQNRNWMGGERFSLPTFTITGVFDDFSELKRKSYDLADMVIPYTSMLPSGQNAQMMQRFMQSTTIMIVKGRTIDQVESQLHSVLSREYGNDVKLYVWEGTIRGDSNVLAETRQSLNTFSLVVNLLGFLLLITGSIGILSIMLVEILGKTRDIALERAMGAAKNNILREYFTRSVVITLISVVFGIILSLVFAQPLKDIVLPIFTTVGDIVKTGTIITPVAILIGSATALVTGGVFGVLPLFATLQTGISEGLREV
jgi:ABC-type antimicrobial peptide transport system permease subunit